MNPKKEYYKNLANTVLKGMEKRHMESYYCETSEDAKALALSLVPGGSTVSMPVKKIQGGVSIISSYPTP